MNIVLAQVMRLIGGVFNILSDTSNDTKKIYLFNAIFNLFSGLQYILLSAITGAIGCFIAIPRNVIFYKYRNKLPIIVLILFLLFNVVINISTIDSIISAIPMVLVMIYTYALYVNDKVFLKWCVIFICFLEIIYDIKYKAYIGIIACFLDIILILISLLKLNKK